MKIDIPMNFAPAAGQTQFYAITGFTDYPGEHPIRAWEAMNNLQRKHIMEHRRYSLALCPVTAISAAEYKSAVISMAIGVTAPTGDAKTTMVVYVLDCLVDFPVQWYDNQTGLQVA